MRTSDFALYFTAPVTVPLALFSLVLSSRSLEHDLAATISPAVAPGASFAVRAYALDGLASLEGPTLRPRPRISASHLPRRLEASGATGAEVPLRSAPDSAEGTLVAPGKPGPFRVALRDHDTGLVLEVPVRVERAPAVLVRARERPPLRRLELGPVQRGGGVAEGQPASGSGGDSGGAPGTVSGDGDLDVEVETGACRPETTCAVFVYASAADDLTIVPSASVEVRRTDVQRVDVGRAPLAVEERDTRSMPAVGDAAAPVPGPMLAAFEVVVHGAEATTVLRGSTGGRTWTRALRLPVDLAAPSIEVKEGRDGAALVTVGTPGAIVDVFAAGRWVDSTAVGAGTSAELRVPAGLVRLEVRGSTLDATAASVSYFSGDRAPVIGDALDELRALGTDSVAGARPSGLEGPLAARYLLAAAAAVSVVRPEAVRASTALEPALAAHAARVRAFALAAIVGSAVLVLVLLGRRAFAAERGAARLLADAEALASRGGGSSAPRGRWLGVAAAVLAAALAIVSVVLVLMLVAAAPT